MQVSASTCVAHLSCASPQPTTAHTLNYELSRTTACCTGQLVGGGVRAPAHRRAAVLRSRLARQAASASASRRDSAPTHSALGATGPEPPPAPPGRPESPPARPVAGAAAAAARGAGAGGAGAPLGAAPCGSCASPRAARCGSCCAGGSAAAGSAGASCNDAEAEIRGKGKDRVSTMTGCHDAADSRERLLPLSARAQVSLCCQRLQAVNPPGSVIIARGRTTRLTAGAYSSCAGRLRPGAAAAPLPCPGASGAALPCARAPPCLHFTCPFALPLYPHTRSQ